MAVNGKKYFLKTFFIAKFFFLLSDDESSPSRSPTFKTLEQKKRNRFSLPIVGKYWEHKMSKKKNSLSSNDYESSASLQSSDGLEKKNSDRRSAIFYRTFTPKKDTILEDKQDDIERNLRALIEKPDDMKTKEEIQKEKRLMALRLEIVRLRHELVYREENKRLKDQ